MTEQEFEEYKMIHNFMYPDESLKAWITKNNAINTFKDDYNALMEVVEKAESLTFKDDEYYNFHILGGCCVGVISSHLHELIYVEDKKSKRDCLYYAIIQFLEFLEWLNQQKEVH
jgi:hypothetical protein